MVRWYLIEDALDSGPKSIGFPDVAPCDGSLSFPDLGAPPYNGSAPVIVYDAACGVPLAPSPPEGGRLGAGSGDDVDRLEVARPSDPSDPYLRSWTKTLPGPIKFIDGSPPCAFPSRVWKSESSATPSWNMLCNVHGGDSWARFTSTTPSLMEWKLVDKAFTIPPVTQTPCCSCFRCPRAPTRTSIISGDNRARRSGATITRREARCFCRSRTPCPAATRT